MTLFDCYQWSALACALFGMTQIVDKDRLGDWVGLVLITATPAVNFVYAVVCFVLFLGDCVDSYVRWMKKVHR